MPSSPNYRRNYKQERATETTTRKEQRNLRNLARYDLIKSGDVAKHDGQDVGHIKALSRGGTNKRSNLTVQDPASNRSFARNPDGSMKSEQSKRERKKK